MRVIKDKINEERIKSVTMRDIARKMPLKKAEGIRKKQQEHYKKFLFFKELNKYMEGKEE